MTEYIVHFVKKEQSFPFIGTKSIKHIFKVYQAQNIQKLAHHLKTILSPIDINQIQEIHVESEVRRGTDRAERVKKEIRGE